MFLSSSYLKKIYNCYLIRFSICFIPIYIALQKNNIPSPNMVLYLQILLIHDYLYSYLGKWTH